MSTGGSRGSVQRGSRARDKWDFSRGMDLNKAVGRFAQKCGGIGVRGIVMLFKIMVK